MLQARQRTVWWQVTAGLWHAAVQSQGQREAGGELGGASRAQELGERANPPSPVDDAEGGAEERHVYLGSLPSAPAQASCQSPPSRTPPAVQGLSFLLLSNLFIPPLPGPAPALRQTLLPPQSLGSRAMGGLGRPSLPLLHLRLHLNLGGKI